MTPETRAFEYAVGVFAVLIGLAIADVATSFHRLLRSKSTVKWDPLALIAALYALCMAIYMWFDLWGVGTLPQHGISCSIFCYSPSYLCFSSSRLRACPTS